MDWKLAIEKNTHALAQIIAGLFLLVGWQKGEKPPDFLSVFTLRYLRTALRKTEAALRRLIVLYVFVHGVKAVVHKQSEKCDRPLPDFVSFGSSSSDRPPVFRLFDPRKPISLILSLSKDEEFSTSSKPRIWFASPTPSFLCLSQESMPEGAEHILHHQADREAAGMDPRHEGEDDGVGGEILPDPTKLIRRLHALDHALKTIPQQAKRLARIMAQREHAPPGPGKVPPMRPGAPPGFCNRGKEEIDFVLRECHGLVRDWESAPP